MIESSLELKLGSKAIFLSTGKWLYPLFDLEYFLNREHYDPAKLTLYDRIIGKASALIIIHLGIRNVTGKIISRPAEIELEKWGVDYNIAQRVDLIDCTTEQMVLDISNPKEVYRLIKEKVNIMYNE